MWLVNFYTKLGEQPEFTELDRLSEHGNLFLLLAYFPLFAPVSDQMFQHPKISNRSSQSKPPIPINNQEVPGYGVELLKGALYFLLSPHFLGYFNVFIQKATQGLLLYFHNRINKETCVIRKCSKFYNVVC